MSYSQAKIHLRLNGWECTISEMQIMYIHPTQGRIQYRTDIRHFSPMYLKSAQTAKDVNRILRGGLHTLLN